MDDEIEALRRQWRIQRKAYINRHGRKWATAKKGAQLGLALVFARKRPSNAVKRNLFLGAKRRARETGLEFTIRKVDLFWPTHCPVLGLELDYSPNGSRQANNPANPSLDRFDNARGYVPGNVFVISMRANQLKSNGTADELEAIARYARHGIPLRVVA